ncbi:glycosyltransferase [Janthinobacterium agaricidamnosum]|uniref:Glycosyl transferase 2 family protein n=1 Tax=Janthinobacterium agaricidamnosum NBRC 102515 = DSM 9628 TaxID=1349767 RepID=W0V7F9_9BURK|nr:glycosyltransferase [Janthinobacterium agaricidamnosum]CDG83288.1 glycosyl transferase 2 family protein [Janthinobacterium agaricidamnosum NBRC 102515 = DSM 9628]
MLTVLMATYNGAATLPKVLQAYQGLIAPPGGWKLLIADNGSSDRTCAVIDQFQSSLPITYLYEGRRGKNAALNSALAFSLQEPGAGDDVFVFSDDDAAPAPDWLLRLAECAKAQPGYTVFGGAIVADWSETPPAWLLQLAPLGLTYGITDPALPSGPVFPGLVWGANMAIRRQVFESGWRFDDSIGPHAARGNYAMGSETLMTRALFDAGYLSWFCPDAVVAHHIRPRQVAAAYVLRRAYQFGRGKFRQEKFNPAHKLPMIARVPRWMWRRFLLECLGLLRASLTGDAGQRFLRRWELAYLRGYFHEAWSGTSGIRPKVLITSYSGELGGMELRMAQEARWLAGAGYDSTLALRRFPGFDDWAATLRKERLPVLVFEPPLFFEQWEWRRLNLWRARLGTAWTLRRQRSDLVHVAFCWSHYGASALWLASHCRLPSVISVHNAFPPQEISAWHRPLLRQAFRSVRGIYAVSESAMAHFLALYQEYIVPATRLTVIPNSVDTERFIVSAQRRIDARRLLNIPPDALVLGSVARLSAQKRPQVLLKLFCALLARFPGLYLVLVGSGPLEAMLRLQAQAAQVGERVIFTGFSAQVELLMPAFDLHLLLSRNEGFGISTIEAMACGVPALGTDVPGTADILRHSQGGLLVPLHDDDAILDALAALLADTPRRLAMGLAARSEAETLYSSIRLKQQVVDFYSGLL